MNDGKDFEGDPATLERLRPLESAERLAQLPPERLLDRLEPVGADSVLDVGAGGGYLTFPAARRTTGTVYAMDADPNIRKVLEYRSIEYGAANVKVIEGRVEQIPLPDSSVDKGMASLIFHILDDPSEGVNELLRVIKPGGSGLIIEWAKPRPDGRAGHRIYEEEMLRLLLAAGAENVSREEWADTYYSLTFRKP
ncbi:class I SAM-dependent methyltransferase [Gorillibacterium timonense]|uniref:class I SAM-dependent methyltransferase n=1 Tax=Gorillibacterium timonense TaxID=1689269 RepID=UPI00071D4C47|nr:class I SAM-dependent methyltransferase [Gorillibacterium timonense]